MPLFRFVLSFCVVLISVACTKPTAFGNGGKNLGDATGFFGGNSIRVAKAFLRNDNSAPVAAHQYDKVALLDSSAGLFLYTKQELPFIPALGSEVAVGDKKPTPFTYTSEDERNIAVAGEAYTSLITYSPEGLFSAMPPLAWQAGTKTQPGNFSEMTQSSQNLYEGPGNSYVLYNPTAQIMNYLSEAFAKPKSVVLQIGVNGQLTTLRFRPQCPGTYSLSVKAESANYFFPDSVLRVYINSAPVAERTVMPGQAAEVALGGHALTPPASIDFAIDYGSMPDSTYNSTKVDAQIFAPQPCP